MEAYDELELIGKGSYGKVFKVRSKADGELYVLKKVAFDGTAQSEAEASLREAHVLSLLRHPHIVPYKEFFKHPDGDLCLVMAYCEGGDMFRLVKSLRRAGKHMEEEQAWQWMVQLLLALSYCHSKKILHRDVKTQNIFLSEGKVMLGDFGLAKQLQRTLEMARTPIGTPYYMAPEIYEEQPYSFKSDVWALGCVLYEMLMGKPAFAADNLSRVVIRVIRGNYDPLPTHYSEELRDVIGLMLCKTVKKRPEVNELLQHPSVVRHVQVYLDSLSAAGPSGWNTWRMKLPPSMLAQMASVIAQSHAAQEEDAKPATTVQPRPVAETPAKAQSDNVSNADDGREAALLPQQLEDVMTGTELLEGFSLQSLLQDVPMVDGPGQSTLPMDQQMLISTMHPDDLARLQPPQTAADWGKYAELALLQQQANYLGGAGAPVVHHLEHQVLSRQVLSVSKCPQAGGAGVGAAGAAGPVGGWGGWGPQEALPAAHNKSMRNATMKNASMRQSQPVDSNLSALDPSISGNGMEWLAVGLPQAGFGFSPSEGGDTPGKAAATASPVKRYDSRASDCSSDAGAAQGQRAAVPARLSAGPAMEGIAEELRQAQGLTGPPSPLGGPTSPVAGMAPRPGRLPPLKHAGVGAGVPSPSAPGHGQSESFSFNSLSSIPSAATPMFHQHNSELFQRHPENILAGVAERYEADEHEAMTMSIGQISLHDTLSSRAVRLRKDLGAMVGADRLAGACEVVRGVQAVVGGDMRDIDLEEMRQALVPVLGLKALSGEQGSNLMAWLDELVFLESRSNNGPGAWA